MDCKAVCFDLDGVLVDTAKYHYLAWSRLAEKLGFTFTIADNERLKGVSRMRSLEILLEIGGIQATQDEKQRYAELKNNWYVAYLEQMEESELFPSVRAFLTDLRKAGIKTALGSASKNAEMILEKLQICDLFDVIIDGNLTNRAKPDPQVFALAVQQCGVRPDECIVFEDAYAGVEAGHAAGCFVVGIGKRENLPNADVVYASIDCLYQGAGTDVGKVLSSLS